MAFLSEIKGFADIRRLKKVETVVTTPAGQQVGFHEQRITYVVAITPHVSDNWPTVLMYMIYSSQSPGLRLEM